MFGATRYCSVAVKANWCGYYLHATQCVMHRIYSSDLTDIVSALKEVKGINSPLI